MSEAQTETADLSTTARDGNGAADQPLHTDPGNESAVPSTATAPSESAGNNEEGDGSANEEELQTIPPEELLPSEKLWASRYDFLLKRGYRLRRRYKPGWKPSWKPGRFLLNYEDSARLRGGHLIDATRLSDGMVVILKHMPKDTSEIEIGTFLWSEDLRNDPRNHSAPLFEVLYDPSDSGSAILVMPQLARVDTPLPVSVREAVDYVYQTLEGLVFMHEHRIAHRDCAWRNIMMDGRKIYPRGWHAQRWGFYPDGVHTLPNPPPTITSVGGVRYYFIDFGISSMRQDFVIGEDCQEPAPELSNFMPYSPYKLDVYIMGMNYHHFLLVLYKRLEFLQPLVDAMSATNPNDRPTAAEAFDRFKEIRAKLTKKDLAQRLLSTSVVETERTRKWNDLVWRLWEFWWSVKPHWRRPKPYV